MSMRERLIEVAADVLCSLGDAGADHDAPIVVDAIVAALAEPSEEIIEEGNYHAEQGHPAVETWRAMLAAIRTAGTRP